MSQPDADAVARDAVLRDHATNIRAVLALCRMTERRKPYRIPVSRQINAFASVALELRDVLAGVLSGNSDAQALARLLCTDEPTTGATS